jgi:hypothetical protein
MVGMLQILCSIVCDVIFSVFMLWKLIMEEEG